MTLGIFLLNGALVSSLIGWIDKRKDFWQNGNIRYKPRDLGKYRYAVVIGANEIAASVIKNLFTPKQSGEINYKCEGNNKYVILHTSRDANAVRDELASHLNKNELKKVIIYKGLRDSANEISDLRLEYATEIYVLGESTLLDGGETYHDAMNMHCVNIIAEKLSESKADREKNRHRRGKSVRKVCKVMFEYQTTSSIFQFSDISQVVKEMLMTDKKSAVNILQNSLIANEKALAICEHNRWNIQQLLMGYSPCDLELDKILLDIESGTDTKSIMVRYKAWKSKNLQSDFLNSNIKDDMKKSHLRIHPNICSFDHLSSIDSKAKTYDISLNNAIPEIISIVDGYKPSGH